MRVEYKQIKISFPMTINGIAKTKDEYAVVDGALWPRGEVRHNVPYHNMETNKTGVYDCYFVEETMRNCTLRGKTYQCPVENWIAEPAAL